MRAAIQVMKDSYLVANSDAVKSVEWVFGRSPVTGKIGPTQRLRQLLDDYNIPWRLNE
jgi:hypothetical protein